MGTKGENFMIKKNNTKGLTLIELIIAMAIGMIVMGIILQIFVTQVKMYNISVTDDKAQVNGANCIAYFRESITNADTVVIFISPTAASSKVPNAVLQNCKDIAEIVPHSNPTSPYVYTISGNKLYKYVEGSTSINPVIASDVNNITLSAAGRSYTVDVEIIKGSATQHYTTIVSKIR